MLQPIDQVCGELSAQELEADLMALSIGAWLETRVSAWCEESWTESVDAEVRDSKSFHVDVWLFLKPVQKVFRDAVRRMDLPLHL